MPSQTEKRLSGIKADITKACAKANRKPASVKVLAATKSQPIEKIRAAAKAGIRLCGENYVQEAGEKISKFPGLEWHFIGHLQSNKARKAVALFDCIQTVDSLRLARKIDSFAEKPFPIFLAVNIASEKTKFGILPENVPAIFQEISELSNIKIQGLFCMAPFLPAEQTRPCFQKMNALARQLNLGETSMGMSNDYTVAVEEGSTIIRLGTALFGPREN